MLLSDAAFKAFVLEKEDFNLKLLRMPKGPAKGEKAADWLVARPVVQDRPGRYPAGNPGCILGS
jgi:hypothetical protein